FSLTLPRPVVPSLFPYTTLFRSRISRPAHAESVGGCGPGKGTGPFFPNLWKLPQNVRPGGRHWAGPDRIEPFGPGLPAIQRVGRSEEHTSELQSRENLVCRLLLE